MPENMENILAFSFSRKEMTPLSLEGLLEPVKSGKINERRSYIDLYLDVNNKISNWNAV